MLVCCRLIIGEHVHVGRRKLASLLAYQCGVDRFGVAVGIVQLRGSGKIGVVGDTDDQRITLRYDSGR